MRGSCLEAVRHAIQVKESEQHFDVCGIIGWMGAAIWRTTRVQCPCESLSLVTGSADGCEGENNQYFERHCIQHGTGDIGGKFHATFDATITSDGRQPRRFGRRMQAESWNNRSCMPMFNDTGSNGTVNQVSLALNRNKRSERLNISRTTAG